MRKVVDFHQFTRQYLIPFTQATKEKLIPYEYSDSFSTYSGEYFPSSPLTDVVYSFDPKAIEEGLVHLNECLYLSMTDQKQGRIDALLKSMRCFSHYLGFYGYYINEAFGSTPSEKWLSDPDRLKEKQYFQAYYDLLLLTRMGLEENPILEGSGQYKDITRQVQTHIDKQNSIANALTHLPRFTAWAKLGNHEQLISTDPLGPRGKVSLPDLFYAIRQRNVAQGYLRPVSEVKEELRNRSHGLIPPLTSKQRL